MKTAEKIIYYTDEQNDDFSGLRFRNTPLGDGFRYMRTGRLARFLEFVFYYVVMIPVVYMLQKVWCHQKFANRKVLRQARKTGCFLVSNHTQVQSDSYIGPLATFPKKCFIISSPQVLSVRWARPAMQAYGVIPVGDTLDTKKEFLRCVESRLAENKAVIVYPEGHVWPYCTKIRPFDYQAFFYLARHKKPMFVLTNCYQKRRLSPRPRIVTYADGPFLADPSLTALEAAKKLRDIAYDVLCRRVETHTTCEFITYQKAQDYS